MRRVVTGLARRIREQYARPGAVAEQAVSSVRTAYSFVAEASTMARFSAALQESARLGLRQGLAKGIAALGSNGNTFAIYAFNVCYGSRLVMYHGYQGGTVFIVSSLIIIGGVYVLVLVLLPYKKLPAAADRLFHVYQPTRSLGSALSNIKCFSEATAAAERVLEMVRRVPKIDSYSDAGDRGSRVSASAPP
ncbi:putative multidrug resistance protein isoform X1 [Miscanthus floridulus]|uniref:putative multidrug resistance protein isoform X1 n=1 Tax=Miscanthus floridulus TaxID=154761 RepID=UPI00345AB570